MEGNVTNIKTGNESLEHVEQIKNLGTNLMNQNSVHEESKSRSDFRDACYHSDAEYIFLQFAIQKYKY
jgi:hypothetical protein